MPILIIGREKVKVTDRQVKDILQALKEGKEIEATLPDGRKIRSRGKQVQLIKSTTPR